MDKDECLRALGVSSGASHAEIKRAFRKLALQYSPDRRAGDEAVLARYRTILEAYQTLNKLEHPFKGESDTAEDRPRLRSFKSFTDVFTAFDEPSEVRCEVEITAEEVASGCEKMVRLHRFRSCERCHGRGGESPCRKCGGAGRIWEEVDVRLKVPARVGDGALLRLPGEGDLKEENGRRGDVYCRIRVE